MVNKKNDPKEIQLWNQQWEGGFPSGAKTSTKQINNNLTDISNYNFNRPLSEGNGMDHANCDHNNQGAVMKIFEMNKLDQIIRKYNLRNDDIAKALKTKVETVSKHRNGKSPITWEMAQKYQTYFVEHHNIMVDSFLLLTAKEKGSELNTNTLEAGKIEIIGQYIQKNHQVDLFPKDWKRIYLQSSMYNHFTFRSAEDWGVVAFIHVNRHNGSEPYNNDLETFFMEDYHYWVCLKSPMKRQYVHKSCLGNFSICKVEGTDEIIVGTVYERPKRTRQAPQKYEVVDPLFSVSGGFISEKNDYSSVSLEYATPILSSMMNVPGSGLGIVQEEDEIRRFD